MLWWVLGVADVLVALYLTVDALFDSACAFVKARSRAEPALDDECPECGLCLRETVRSTREAACWHRPLQR